MDCSHSGSEQQVQTNPEKIVTQEEVTPCTEHNPIFWSLLFTTMLLFLVNFIILFGESLLIVAHIILGCVKYQIHALPISL